MIKDRDDLSKNQRTNFCEREDKRMVTGIEKNF
jgi:hypothetical protein